MKNIFQIIKIISSLVAFSATSHALITTTSILNDGITNGSYSVDQGSGIILELDLPNEDITVGTGSNAANNFAGVFTFQLPSWENLDAGAAFSRASISMNILAASEGTPGNARLEILRYGANLTNITTADETVAGLPGTTVNNFITSTDAFGSTVTNQNMLSAFFNANGYNAGEYLVMRISMQTPETASNQRWLLSRDVTLTVVPEPSTYALIAGSIVLGVCMLRRRKKA